MEDSGTQILYGDFIARFRELGEKVRELERLIDGQIAEMEEILSGEAGRGTETAPDEAPAEDKAEKMTDGLPEDITGNITGGIPEGFTGDLSEGIAENLPENITGSAPESIIGNNLENTTGDIQKSSPENSPKNIPSNSRENIPETPEEDASKEIPLRIEIGESLDIVPLGEAIAKTDTVADKMAARESWRTDMPGAPVNDIRSAISLNDRIIFINTLFGEDPVAFKETLSQLNGAASFEDGVRMVLERHPEWNTASETVYRFMMAVRRKLK